MAIARLTVKNQTQKITNQRLNGNSSVVGTTVVTLLTVAAGKRVEVLHLSVRYISFGGNTNMDVTLGGRRLRRAAATELNLIDLPAANNQTLIAGETITLVGDNAADNGSIDFMISFRETPA